MLNKIKIHSWLTWGLAIVVIMVILQVMSVTAEKDKTLDVIPIGGSDEFYEREYRPPPRPRSPPSPPRKNGREFSDEYYTRAKLRQDEMRRKKMGLGNPGEEGGKIWH